MDSNAITGIIIFLVAVVIAFWKQLFPATETAPAGGSGSPGSGSGEPGGSESGFLVGQLWDFPTVSAPDQVRKWYEPAKDWAEYYGLPWQVVLAIIWQESAGDPQAVGSSGEVGLMQLKDIAVQDARESGYQVPADWINNPLSNIVAGVSFLDLQRKRTGSIREALKAYNQGEAGARENPILANTYADEVLTKAQKLGYFV